jgi:hypothetical protein
MYVNETVSDVEEDRASQVAEVDKTFVASGNFLTLPNDGKGLCKLFAFLSAITYPDRGMR